MGTRVERHSAERNLVQRGRAYAMPCVEFDGNDIEAVIEQATRAADRARAGKGPSFLVAHTFRFRGFSMSDPLKYRTKQEAEQGKANDPIPRYQRKLIERGILTDQILEDLQSEIAAQVDQAIEFAKASSNPRVEDRFTDVLAEKYPFQGRSAHAT